MLRHAQPARPAPIEIVGEPPFEAALLAELERDLDAWPPGDRVPAALLDDLRGAADGLGGVERRAVRDARGGGIAGLLGDLVAAGAPVLAVTAHAGQRAAALRDRVGGFAVTTWAALEADPALARGYPHVVAVDPPSHAHLRALAERLPGDGWTHLAWGGAELELARRVLAWELDLRPQLAELYRALRTAAAPAGSPAALGRERLLAVLGGSGPQPRSGSARRAAAARARRAGARGVPARRARGRRPAGRRAHGARALAGVPRVRGPPAGRARVPRRAAPDGAGRAAGGRRRLTRAGP